MTHTDTNRRLLGGVRIAGWIAALMGGYWLMMWLVGLAALRPASVMTPKTNIALCQLLGGVVLLLLGRTAPTRAGRSVGLVLACVIFLVGALTISQDLFQYNFGIDELLANDVQRATGAPNRMGILAAASLLLLGAAFIALALRRPVIVPYLGLTVALINLVPAISYLYGTEELFIPPRLRGVAWQSVVALTALGVGAILAVREHGPLTLLLRQDAGGVLLRKMLPPVILLPLLMGYVRTRGHYLGWYEFAVGTGLLVILLILFFLLFLWRSASHLSRTAAAEAETHRALWRSEETLRRLNEELERRVEERTRELAAANKELETFSYTVSHDLKAPLRVIMGFSRTLSEKAKAKLDDREQRQLDVIATSANEMSHLIDVILSFSRLGRQALKPSEIDMEALVRSVVEQQQSNHERRVEVSIGALPTVRADHALMKQVLVNLISNAFKFTRNTEHPVIEIGSTRQDGEIICYVRDNGAGFDMKRADRLFGVFQRLHNAQQYEGSGVGLAFSKRIVERHGGRMWAHGKVNEGATLYVALPNCGLPTQAEEANNLQLSRIGGTRPSVSSADPFF